MVLPCNNVALWLEGIAEGREQAEVDKIEAAAHFAIEVHYGQKRKSGEDYVNHPFAVAAIVHELGLDSDAVIAALLHDSVEDTSVTLDDLSKTFGADVAKLVDGVTKMEVIKGLTDPQDGKSKQDIKAESLRKMMLAMVDDVRVVLIKLSDRLHNMRTLGAVGEEQQKRVATETLEIFSPLANRLGVWQIKWELEDLAFRYIEPDIYKKIANKLAERRVDRQSFIEEFVDDVKHRLDQQDVQAIVGGRAKHIYSIWSKMQRKDLPFEQLSDVRAVRILVGTVHDCYRALGVVHSKWKHVPGEFDDYIATPKENNYRSIHTAVVGPGGRIVEVQIRTNEMHEYNEIGIAAHWRYKEGRAETDQAVNNKVLWLRQLLEWQNEVANASEFVDRIKDEVFENRVYVFSPEGKVIDLPYDSTPLDFAYAIHTEVGHRCRGAKVNGRMVSLKYRLKSGEQVAILTAKSGKPSLDWIDPIKGYARSRRARSRIQHWFRSENKDDTIAHGRQLLEREFDRMNLVGVNHEQLAKKLGVLDAAEMYLKLVDGSIRPGRTAVIAQQMLQQFESAKQTPDVSLRDGKRDDANSNGFVNNKAANDDRAPTNLSVQGVTGLMTSLGKCCQPIPGDKVLGFTTINSGITIHRQDCPNILYQQHAASERVVEVSWGSESTQSYPMSIIVCAYDRGGLLQDISSVFADEKINIMRLNTLRESPEHSVQIDIGFGVSDLEQMSRLLAKIEQLPNVFYAKRKR